MADGIDVDFSEFEALSVNLGRAGNRLVLDARPVVKRALQNIKDDTRANVSDHPTWKRLASTVGYDVFGLDGVVGYADRGQGELAGIYEFGSATRAPHPTLYPAAGRELPRFEKAMADVMAEAVEGAL